MSELINLQGLSNTRDLGGMSGADGRKIIRRKLIRSGHLHSATQTDIERLSGCVDLSGKKRIHFSFSRRGKEN